MQQSVYPKFSHAVNRIFAGMPPEKILVVPVDFAIAALRAAISSQQFCGFGEIACHN